MLARSIAKYLRISMLLLVAQLAGVTLAHAQGQITITFRGRVMYSTGDPAQGATVTMTTTVIGGTSTQTAAADSGGNFTFQIERDPAQGIACSFRAASSEIVDDEPLPPSGTISASGGLTGTVGIGDLIIARPTEITLGGVVRDQFNTPVQGLTITMTRAKGNLPPSAITTATTTTDAAGHYQFTTFGRCNVVEEFKVCIE